MGVSTDGQLSFGVDFGEEYPERLRVPALADGDDEFEDLVYRDAGVPMIPEDYKSETEDARELRWRLQNEARAACPVKHVIHCSYDYGMHILAVRGFHYRASRGDAMDLTAEQLSVPAERIEAFKKWLADHGVEAEEPRWILSSLWG